MNPRFLTPILLLLPLLGGAQNKDDVLRYSRTYFGGTARNIGLSGAFGALGADISTLNNNPGGIAMFRKSEITVSPGFASNISHTSFAGATNKDTKYNLNINNLGYVGTFPIKNSNWKSVHFGIAYNRMANFHNNILVTGENRSGTILDDFVSDANGFHPSELESARPFTAYHAYQNWLIDPLSGDSLRYQHKVKNSRVNQERSIQRKGSMGETSISFGADYSNLLYLGASIGIPSINFNENITHIETTVDSAAVDTFSGGLQKFQYTEGLSTEGNGFNFKIGAIVRPADWVRLGLAIHSPSILSMKDEWWTSMKSRFHDGSSYETQNASRGEYDYRIFTPFRAQGNLAFIVGKRGVISADYEFVDYSQGELKLSIHNQNDPPYTQENQIIRNQLTQASNLRIGTEWRLPPFAVRGGYAQYTNPYEGGFVSYDDPTRIYSFGAGFREESFFLDGAVSIIQWAEDHYMYDSAFVDAATIRNSMTRIVFTAGFRF